MGSAVPAKEHPKDHPVIVEHSPGHSLVADLKEGRGDDVQPLLVVLDPTQPRVVHQYRVENVQEELEAVLVQEVDLVQVIDCEVDAGTCRCLERNQGEDIAT